MIEGGFPIYILDDNSILYLKKGWSHTKFWKQVVCEKVAKKYGIAQNKLKNLPYCQRRARVVGNNFYCGEQISKALLKNIEKTLGMKLKHIYDEHETRCKISTAEFKGLRSPSQQ